MSDGSLRIESLRVESFLGIPAGEGFALQNCSPGINLLLGPNGCGKTTTARALQQLLWPADRQDEHALLHGVFRAGAETWELDLRGRQLQAWRDGTVATPPDWAPPETRRRYHWTLKDLMDQDDRDLARRVATDMQGGVDLDAAAQALAWDARPPAPRKLAAEVRRLEQEVRDLRGRQRSLQDEADRMGDLRGEMEACRRVADRLPDIEWARDALRRRLEWENLCRELEDAAPVMSRLREDDLEHWRRWAERLRACEAEQSESRDRRERLLPGGEAWKDVPTSAFAETTRAVLPRLRALQGLERERLDARNNLREAEAAEQRLRDRLRLGDEAAALHARGYSFEQFRACVNAYVAWREAEAEAQARRAHAAQPELPRSLAPEEVLREGIRDLEAWLGAEPESRPDLAPLLASLLFATGLIGWQAWREHLLWLLGLLIPLFIGLWSHLAGRDESERERFQQEQRYRTRMLPKPEAWQADQVRECILALRQQVEAVRERKLREQEEAKLREAEQRAERLRQPLRDAATALAATGLGLPVDEGWMAHALLDLQAWRQSLDLVHARRARLAEEEQRVGERLADLRQVLAPWIPEPGRDLVSLEGAWEGLKVRFEQETARRRDLADVETRLRDLAQRHTDIRNERQGLLQRLGLPEEEMGALAQWTAALPAWRETFRKSETLARRVSEDRKRLANAPDLLLLDGIALEHEAIACERQADRADDLREQLTRLDQRMLDAQRGRDLHEALERLFAAREQLAAERQRQAELRAGQALLDWLREEVRSRQRPQVFEQANAHLVRFTQGELQLELTLAHGEERFLARRGGQAPRELSILSTGERAQVLMAVRLAFLSASERVALPLFVDEALGTSDDQRAERILSSLIDLARNGRQVFYLTAQRDEADKWRTALARENVPCRVFDIDELRKGERAEKRPLPAPKVVPPPDVARRADESAHDYAQRMRVPAWHPRDAVESLHVWHLFHDTAPVECLLAHRIERWGALRALLDHGGADALLDEGKRRHARAMGRAIEAAREAWWVGRAPSVTLRHLLESGAVSEIFIDDVAALNREIGGDGPGLLRALEDKRVPGWRQNKTEELRLFFDRAGLLPRESPLDAATLRARLYASLQSQAVFEDLTPADLEHVLALVPYGT